MKNKHKGIPDIGRGVQVGYIKPDPRTIKGKSKYKCTFFDADSGICSVNYTKCVGTSHYQCKYSEREDLYSDTERPISSGVVNNGTVVTLKRIPTGEEIKIEVNSHKNPEHIKLLGKNPKTNAIVADWEGFTYFVYKVE